MSNMLVTHSIEQTRTVCSILQGSLGFVPTMGALHEGHLTLVRAAKERCSRVAVSIFVNPKQFGAHEDLGSYPRPLEKDLALLEAEGVDVVFTPEASAIYPDGFATTVHVGGLGDMLCGASRTGHFEGVTTVVTMLFSFLRPQYAFFGEKDFQQLAIIKRLNRDLLLVDEVVGVPTVREADGLALSSRNQYLTKEERAKAPILQQQLQMIRSSEDVVQSCNMAKRTLREMGVDLEYLDVRDQDSLQEVSHKTNARAFIAAQFGASRLIDNIALD